MAGKTKVRKAWKVLICRTRTDRDGQCVRFTAAMLVHYNTVDGRKALSPPSLWSNEVGQAVKKISVLYNTQTYDGRLTMHVAACVNFLHSMHSDGETW